MPESLNISWLMDADGSHDFAVDISDLIVSWNTDMQVDWYLRTQDVGRAEVVVDRLAFSAIFSQIEHGTALRCVDGAHGGFNLYTGYVNEIEDLDVRYSAIRLRSLMTYLDFHVDYPQLMNKSGIEVVRRLLESASPLIPLRRIVRTTQQVLMTWGDEDTILAWGSSEEPMYWSHGLTPRGIVRYARAGVEGAVVNSAVLTGPPARAVHGESDIQFDVFDGYVLSGTGFQSGTVLNALRRVALTEVGWIHEDGAGDIVYRPRSYSLASVEPAFHVDDQAIRHERYRTRNAVSVVTGEFYEFIFDDDILLYDAAGKDFDAGWSYETHPASMSGDIVILDGSDLRFEYDRSAGVELTARVMSESYEIAAFAAEAASLTSLRIYGSGYVSSPVGTSEVFTGVYGGENLRFRGRARNRKALDDVMTVISKTLTLAASGIRSIRMRQRPAGAYQLLDIVRSSLLDGTARDYLITGINHVYSGRDGRVATTFEFLPVYSDDYAYVGHEGRSAVGRVKAAL